MVACTTLGLPYQEGTDAACDMSEIWCAFVAVMEDYAIDIQNIVNRTAVAVPMAKVAKNITETYEFVLSGEQAEIVAFDGVIVDNDGMADLVADNGRVFPRRAGLWDVVASVEFIPDAAQTDIEIYLIYSVGNVVINTPATLFIVPGPLEAVVNIHGRVEVTAADLAGYVVPSISLAFFWTGNGATTDLTVSYADLHVYWTAEEVP